VEKVCPVKTKEIKLGGSSGLYTIVYESDYISLNLGLYRWGYQKKGGYVRGWVKKKNVLLHRLIMGVVDSPHSVLVDHRDHNGLNNTRTNLRITNHTGNYRNSLPRGGKSRFKGVVKDPEATKKIWRAKIGINGKSKYLGHYLTEVEAAKAYNEAATEFFGEFACLNAIPS
jgi:hypothetical protein